MTIIDELAKQYLQLDDRYAAEEFQASARGWSKREARIKRARELNDQAYFLYMFTRLEDRIRQQSAAVVVRRRKQGSWRQRAAWENLPTKPDSTNFSFRDRVAVLCQRGHTDFNLLVGYYDSRNVIAHGGVAAIAMPVVIADFKRLWRASAAS